MYTREIQAPRASPIENGIPLQGTWTEAFDQVDLLDIHRPFQWPLPRWMRDSRIKEWESLIIQNNQLWLSAIFANLKAYGIAQISLYDKETQEKTRFLKLTPFSGWRLPKKLSNSSINSRSRRFFFRVHNWLAANTIKADFDIQGSLRRPALTAHVEYDVHISQTRAMVVNLPISGRRSMYAYKALAPVRGDIVWGSRHISLDSAGTSGIFCDYKGFYPYIMQSAWCSACGFDGENRRYGFSIGETQSMESFKNSENALWHNGSLTPLPPVRITMPKGVESDWVIQDVEGMVDLTFTPKTPMQSAMDLIVTKAEYFTPLGYFNGMLVNSNGEQIQVHNLWGMGEKLYLRV